MSTPVSPTVHRPFGVGFLSILMMISGALDVISGIVLLFQSGDEDILAATGVSSSDVNTYAIVAIVIGALVLFTAFALRNGANWARLLIAILAAVRLATLIWVVAAYHNVHWYHAFWPAAIYTFIAGYLFFDNDAKRFFSQGRV